MIRNQETISEELAKVNNELREAEQKGHYYHQQLKILEHRGQQLLRKKRNHRIFTRGGMLESFLREPLLLTDDQVYQILRESFSDESVRELENKLINESTIALMREADMEDTG